MHHAKNTLAMLKKKGFRMTKTRTSLIELLSKHGTPLSAPEILDILRPSFPSLNKTTVYRELFFLKDQNVVHEIQFGDGATRYELSAGPHHHHVVCMNCNAVTDIVLEKDLHDYTKSIEKETGFQIESHSLEFFGLCRKCQ